ncbi:LysR family transcriptional regulator [Sphingomonas sp. M1-B02]|uniref:LysR family transcriptional regulator n=1 Tax=Sphingomonas sp. M1-B02 TaxID=3114300 RepID=UPI00223F738D|nr:LysR family transcriptional regulator [Sphingomonas sp. S6-11]UZK65805.1 LysR family transcriptional regulator [Sphingomonas sp. S6-11]
MDRPQLPLNALRAFEASARHLSFTRAGLELCVSQGAVSHQVKALEERLGVPLFRRLPRGIALTDEGLALVPVVQSAFDAIGATLGRFSGGRFQEVLTVGVVATFAIGWLLERLPDFTARHPGIDLRLLTNNNRVDLAGEGLDVAIRFGNGAWHGTHSDRILDAALTPLCAPALAAGLASPADLVRHPLLRSYRADEWPLWFAQAGTPCPPVRGPVFDSSPAMAAAAMAGFGVALLPAAMFARDLAAERLVRPFPQEVATGAYWLTRLHSRAESPAMAAFRGWLLGAA